MFNLVALYFINFFCFRACRNFALMICTLINNYNRPLWFKHIPENGCSQRHGGGSPSSVIKGDIFRKGVSFPSASPTVRDTGCRGTRGGSPSAAGPARGGNVLQEQSGLTVCLRDCWGLPWTWQQ